MPDELKNAIEHEELKASVRALHIQLESNSEVTTEILKGIQSTVNETLRETQKTNGRVTKLEDVAIKQNEKNNDRFVLIEDTLELFRAIKKHKWLKLVLLLALIQVVEITSFDNIRIVVNWIISFL